MNGKAPHASTARTSAAYSSGVAIHPRYTTVLPAGRPRSGLAPASTASEHRDVEKPAAVRAFHCSANISSGPSVPEPFGKRKCNTRCASAVPRAGPGGETEVGARGQEVADDLRLGHVEPRDLPQ